MPKNTPVVRIDLIPPDAPSIEIMELLETAHGLLEFTKIPAEILATPEPKPRSMRDFLVEELEALKRFRDALSAMLRVTAAEATELIAVRERIEAIEADLQR